MSCYYTIMNRETFIAKLTEIQENVGHLLPNCRLASTTSSRLISTALVGNTGQFACGAGKGWEANSKAMSNGIQIAAGVYIAGNHRLRDSV